MVLFLYDFSFGRYGDVTLTVQECNFYNCIKFHPNLLFENELFEYGAFKKRDSTIFQLRWQVFTRKEISVAIPRA